MIEWSDRSSTSDEAINVDDPTKFFRRIVEEAFEKNAEILIYRDCSNIEVLEVKFFYHYMEETENGQVQLTRGAQFNRLNFTNSKFIDCEFENSPFYTCVFNHTDFSISKFTNVAFHGCAFKQPCFEDCKLTGVSFRNHDLRGASFKNATLTYCNFDGCDLRYVDFSGANLHYCTIRKAQLQFSNMTHATILSEKRHNLKSNKYRHVLFDHTTYNWRQITPEITSSRQSAWVKDANYYEVDIVIHDKISKVKVNLVHMRAEAGIIFEKMNKRSKLYPCFAELVKNNHSILNLSISQLNILFNAYTFNSMVRTYRREYRDVIKFALRQKLYTETAHRIFKSINVGFLLDLTKNIVKLSGLPEKSIFAKLLDAPNDP